jgi:quercetin dioxygenase-like cupin family protein
VKGFKLLSHGDIENSLNAVTRQYLVGNLKRPQELEHIVDNNVEIGISDYRERTTELPHYHTKAMEYQYVIVGATSYLNLKTGEEETYNEGDFYAIYPNTAYAQKSSPGTRILFVKLPSINDKQLCNTNETIEKWYAE